MARDAGARYDPTGKQAVPGVRDERALDLSGKRSRTRRQARQRGMHCARVSGDHPTGTVAAVTVPLSHRALNRSAKPTARLPSLPGHQPPQGGKTFEAECAPRPEREPAGFENFLLRLSAPAQLLTLPPASAEPPALDEMMAAAATFELEILGPPGNPKLNTPCWWSAEPGLTCARASAIAVETAITPRCGSTAAWAGAHE